MFKILKQFMTNGTLHRSKGQVKKKKKGKKHSNAANLFFQQEKEFIYEPRFA